MQEELIKLKSPIKRSHSIRWTPKYQEEFLTDLKKSFFIPVTLKVIEELGWDLVYKGENFVEARRKNKWDKRTEKITMTYDNSTVTVKSISLNGILWDCGQNSLRVKMFIHAFKQFKIDASQDVLKELENKLEQAEKWNNYIIPKSLPQPTRSRTPQLYIVISGAFISSIFTGCLCAFLSMLGLYIVGIYETGVALLLALLLKEIIRASNFTQASIINYILLGIVFFTYFSKLYFEYIYFNEVNYESIDFIEFLLIKLNDRSILSYKISWIGSVISWGLQIGFTYLIAHIRTSLNIINYQIQRVPNDVTHFAYYHFVKGKTELQVRTELSEMGWSNKQNQDEVFESIFAVQGFNEYNRMD